jgi:hypothetical protein
VLSIAVTAIIMGALTSAMIVAGKALPSRENSAEGVIAAAGLADQIAAELHAAVLINGIGPTRIDFTVADRNGDGNPERIRYDWTVAGAPLMRTYNAGTPVAVVLDVHAFELKSTQRSITETYPGAPVESAETLLSSYSGNVNATDYPVTSTNWVGQYFVPTLPGGTQSWKVTRVTFEAKSNGSSAGQTAVQMRTLDASSLPATTVLQQFTMNESALSVSYTTQQFTFTGVSGRTPGTGLALVLQWLSDAHACDIRCDSGGGSNRVTTSNAGASWSKDAGKSVRHAIYGTYSTPAADQSATRQYVTGIRIGIQPGADTARRVDTNVNLPNQPEVLVDCWELDFSRDPTAVDIDADAVMDWKTTSGGAFVGATLVNGVWLYDNAIEVLTPTDFNNLLTVDLRCRDIIAGDGGPNFRVHIGWDSASRSAIYTDLTLNADLTQTLVINEMKTGWVLSPLLTVTGLPNAMTDIRLLIDPTLDTVCVTVNGQHRGTVRYGRYLLAGLQHLGLGAFGNGAQYDYVRVRQGGTSP